MKVGIPSLLSTLNEKNHRNIPIEQDANIRAFKYFKEYYSADFDTFDSASGEYNGKWVWYNNKYAHDIVDMDWTNYGHYPLDNLMALSKHNISVNKFELILSTNYITYLAGGFINAAIQYNRY